MIARRLKHGLKTLVKSYANIQLNPSQNVSPSIIARPTPSTAFDDGK